MGKLSITGQIKVSTLQEGFLKEFGLTLRIYDGRSFADPTQTLAQVRKKKGSGKALSVAKNMKVGNLEEKFEEEFGLKVQVAGSNDSYLCDNNLTLNGARQEDDKKLGRKERKAMGQNNTDSYEDHYNEKAPGEHGYAVENDSGADDKGLENDDSENQSSKTHTYLAGVGVEGEGVDDLISSVLKFVDAAYYKLSMNPEIYLVGTSNKDGEFLGSHQYLQSVKVFKGSYSHDDDEPNEENVRQVLQDNEGLNFLDENYAKVWFAFKYAEESSDEFESPGDHWIYDFQQLAQNLDDLALVGYNSKFESKIWQEWAGGELDEGAISNEDALDHYSGSNIESIHSINLGCFTILD